jgi:predicted ATP-grasp superfamily ATP-dependent carboligase
VARVLVTDAYLGSATAVIRSLGRRHHVIAAGSDRISPGFRSKYAAERLLHPDARARPQEMAEALLAAVERRRVDLVVAVTDETILPISALRERFERVCTLALPDPAALAIARDKQATLALAERLGVPTPRTGLVRTVAEARARVAEVGWPVVLKPMASRVFDGEGGIEELGVAYAGGFAGLEQHMARFEGLCPVLLQRYHAGGAVGVELLMHAGRPLAAFQHRRLREVPITGGASSFRESVPLDPELYDHSVRLLGELGWTGLAMVEFKLTEDGPVLMEINGRIWGSLPLAVRSGMDFPARMADLFLSGPPAAGTPPATGYRVGVRSRHLELDVVWVASVLRRRRRYPFLATPRRRDAVRAGLRLVLPGDGYDMVVPGDPRPAITDVVRIGRKLWRKAAHAS